MQNILEACPTYVLAIIININLSTQTTKMRDPGGTEIAVGSCEFVFAKSI